ncbi:MAG TPA: diacylglycerol kinase family protein [Gaiellales bacterium]|nr:diacylglycerol kinase family protein [Gaiellales bacterium]
MTETVMIVNPASANGRTAEQWPEIARQAGERGLRVDVRLTQGPGHATELAAAAVAEGAELVLAVGGDGTVSEIANGMAGAPATDLAVVERGSGCDFVRTFGISKKTHLALDVAATAPARTIDLGRVTYTGPDGTPTTRYFANIASAGLTGVAADRVNRGGKPLGATVAFAWAAVVTFATYRNSRFVVEIDGEVLDQTCNNAIVANCRYFAGGMKILPHADPSDGMLDVLVWGDVSKVDLALNLHKLYRGTHVTHPKATIRRARRVIVTPETPLPIEVDGEQPGITPAAFDVVPSALRLRAPAG